ncbi:hypothetical protein D3OALGA1CA_3597 [Olavius algarvensis associated proteobacterium Delta 3]|nr:hypothetical protein D3OALGB2SA_2276 [Olavius algarvensis associated proteobacterium Delta 3]CAB5136829.1 hypothetical protein D3OALGA1CA_3597 [Olavius algarvensis associated proteobacterium Delta 3]
MLTAERKIFTPTYHFFEDDDYFGTLRASFFIPKAVFIAREGNYKFYREKLFEGKYFCDFHYDCKAIAEKPQGIGYSYSIKHKSISYLLKPGSLFNEMAAFQFELYEGNELLGSIYENPTKFILSIEMEREVSRILQCFIFWLGFRAWIGLRGWRYVTGDTRAAMRF